MLTRLVRSLDHRILRTPETVKEAARKLFREWEATRMSKKTLPRFSALGRGLKLHLGCGADVRGGWVNIDLNLNHDAPLDSPDFFNYDLRLGLPLPDGSASLVYSSHFWEHLPNGHGLKLFKESFRVLESGGTFRIALPNQPNLFRYYERRDRSYWHMLDVQAMCPGVPAGEITYGDFVDTALYQWGEHVAFYDVERTVRILRSVGFVDVREDEYSEGVDPADELRRFGSFYVTARR